MQGEVAGGEEAAGGEVADGGAVGARRRAALRGRARWWRVLEGKASRSRRRLGGGQEGPVAAGSPPAVHPPPCPATSPHLDGER